MSSDALFPLGQQRATPAALHAMQRCGLAPSTLMARHRTGDWGELHFAYEKANYDAIEAGRQIFSAFLYPGSTFYVITTPDRSTTTICLPCEVSK